MNVAVTTRSVRLVVAQPVAASAAHLAFMLRLLAVLAAIFLALHVLGAAPIPFAVGLLAIVPAALWHGLSQAREA